MLKNPFSNMVVVSNMFPKSVTTGAINPLAKILFWIVFHIIRPKKGGHSRVDRLEVQLVYSSRSRLRFIGLTILQAGFLIFRNQVEVLFYAILHLFRVF